MPRLLMALLAGATLLMGASACSAQTSRAQTASASATGDAAFGARVRTYLLAHPEVLAEAMQKLQDKETAQAAAAARSSILTHRAALDHDPRDPVEGNPHGSATLVEFFDYRCPYCRVAAPELPAFLKLHPDVRLVMKEFPILSEQSETAARYALAAAAQGKYWPVHQGLMKLAQLNDAAIQGVLRENGVDMTRARTDADSPAIRRQIEDVHALAVALGINGTPTFIVGDTLSAGWLPQELGAALQRR